MSPSFFKNSSLIICIGFLASCGPLNDSKSNTQDSYAYKQSAEHILGHDQLPQSKPMPAASEAPMQMNKTPEMLQPMAQAPINQDLRISALETRMTDLQREFEELKVEIAHMMMAKEKAKPAPKKAAPAPAKKKHSSAKLVPKSIQNFRIGKHPDRMRLVLDAAEKTPYTVDLDSTENLLVIETPNAKWIAAKSKTFSSKTSVVSSYQAEAINNGQGTRLVIALKKPTRILDKKLLPPNTTPFHRIYVDLAL